MSDAQRATNSAAAAPRRGKQPSFHEQLARESRAMSAKRQPHRDLPPATRRAKKEQRRDVRERHQ